MKYFLSILLFSLICAQVSAQKEVFEKELYIGVGGGALMSSVDFVPNVLQKQQFGIHGGVSAKYISEKHLGLLLEVNYAQRGWKEDFPAESGFAYHRTLHYLEVPFMTHVFFGKKVRFIINAGPQISILMGSTANMNDALTKDIAARKEQNPKTPIGIQYSAEPRKFDYGIIGGLGMELSTGIGNIELEGRYYFGLGDIFESRKSHKDFYFNRSAHRIIEAKLSYFFKVK